MSKLDQARATQKAQAVWNSMDANERRGVRFGMFPAGKMQTAEAELAADGFTSRDIGRLLSVALTEIAEKNGGMIA
jgi:hypothetical protein